MGQNMPLLFARTSCRPFKRILKQLRGCSVPFTCLLLWALGHLGHGFDRCRGDLLPEVTSMESRESCGVLTRPAGWDAIFARFLDGSDARQIAARIVELDQSCPHVKFFDALGLMRSPDRVRGHSKATPSAAQLAPVVARFALCIPRWTGRREPSTACVRTG